MTLKDMMIEALWWSLWELRRAVLQLQDSTIPSTPLPHPRIFVLVENPKVVWPFVDGKKVYWNVIKELDEANEEVFTTMELPDRPPSESDVRVPTCVDRLLWRCRWRPRRVWRLIERVQQATKWCQERWAGRQRLAATIVEAQKKYLKKIEALVTMYEIERRF